MNIFVDGPPTTRRGPFFVVIDTGRIVAPKNIFLMLVHISRQLYRLGWPDSLLVSKENT
jgi:hypothetical protein